MKIIKFDKIIIDKRKFKDYKDSIININYIDSLDYFFCLCQKRILCFNCCNYERNKDYEKEFNEEKDINYFYYQKSTDKLFISINYEDKTSIYELKKKKYSYTYISESISKILDISHDKIIILDTNKFCQYLKYNKKDYIEIKSYKHQKLNDILITPNKDKIICSTNDSFLLININNFQLAAKFKTNGEEYQLCNFINNTDLIIIFIIV